MRATMYALGALAMLAGCTASREAEDVVFLSEFPSPSEARRDTPVPSTPVVVDDSDRAPNGTDASGDDDGAAPEREPGPVGGVNGGGEEEPQEPEVAEPGPRNGSGGAPAPEEPEVVSPTSAPEPESGSPGDEPEVVSPEPEPEPEPEPAPQPNPEPEVAAEERAGDANLELFWLAPDTDASGQPLDDLAGYRIYDGRDAGRYTMVTDVGFVTDYELTGLEPGTYYIAVTAVDVWGNESEFSDELLVVVN